MTKRRYRPYRTRKQLTQRRMLLNIALALIVLVVGVVILKQTSGNSNPPEEMNEDSVRTMDEVLGDNEPATPATTEAKPTPTPTATPAAKPQVTSVEPPKTAQPVVPAAADKPVVETVQGPSGIQTPPADGDSTSPEARQLIEKATELRGQGKIIAARDLLNHSLDLKLSSVVRAKVKEQMAILADTWLFDRDVYDTDKLTSYYLVQPGDLLAVIAKRYKVPYEALMEINGIERPELLRAGAKIKVIDGPFNAVIYKNSYTLDLYLQNVYVKTYRVGLGKAEYDTPTGRWLVKPGGKLIQPKWTDPDTGKVYVGSAPDYPLGSRWIALDGLDGKAVGRTGFAIHGTKEPQSIGTRSSRGCIRLHNGDVIEVYNLLQEGISEVLVVD